ncbi:MAG: single-stranded DNA-binding protein [archaeon]
MKINELKINQKKINLVVKVLSKSESRKVVSRLDSVEHNVCEALIGDETGTVLITLWDETIDKLEIGKVYNFDNLFTSEFKRSLRLNIGRFGIFQIIDKDIEVNTTNEMSPKVEL